MRTFDITTKRNEKILQLDSPIKCFEWNPKIVKFFIYFL